MNILELYSGIGGMHYALEASGVSGRIVAAVDINTTANDVYHFNFPNTLIMNKNIESLTLKKINQMEIDMILMSPPCQPFTRNGLQGDINDSRASSFLYILKLLKDLKTLKYILIENVKGFECSNTRNILISSLEKSDFSYQEFIINSVQLGIPNSRTRYYCLAKKQIPFSFVVGPLMNELPVESSINLPNSFKLISILDHSLNTEEYLLSDKDLKYLQILDICHSNSERTRCFTRAYYRYLEGTGSIYTSKSQDEIEEIKIKLNNTETESAEYIKIAKQMELRFFSPREIARLMCFPEKFNFPNNVKMKQQYKLLGNSINVRVVAELIKVLVDS